MNVLENRSTLIAGDERGMRDALAGSLRASDVRRFFVEVMVAAMNADGHVDERELAALRRILDEHELFCALPPAVSEQLILTGTDALDYADNIFQRIPIIAANLLSRSHRLFAFAMACEVIAADEAIDPAEQAYLDKLRDGLSLTQGEHATLLAAANTASAMAAAERLTASVVRWVPALTDVCLIRALLTRHFDTEAMFKALCALPDFAQHAPQIRLQLTHIPADVSAWSVNHKLAELSQLLPSHTDRYWLATYALAIDALGGVRGQRAPFFAATLQRAFNLSNSAMQRAMMQASAIAARVPFDPPNPHA